MALLVYWGGRPLNRWTSTLTLGSTLFALTPDTIAQCVTAAVSAGLGTWAAFRLETMRDDSRKRDAQLSSLRAALFVLAQQRSLLLNISRQILTPHRDDPARAYVILPHTLEALPLNLSLGELLFLLEGDPDALNALQNADQWFRLTQTLIDVRSRAHAAMQEKLEAAKPAGNAISMTEIQKAIGPTIAAKLEQTTDQLFEITEKALMANRRVYSQLESVTRRKFPKANVLAVAEVP